MTERLRRSNPPGLPAPVNPYVHTMVAVRAGLLFISGQGPVDANDQVAGTTIAEQTHQVFRNLEKALAAHGCGFQDVLKFGIFLTDINDFQEFSLVRREYLKGVFPASTLVGNVRLVTPQWKVEVEAVAALP